MNQAAKFYHGGAPGLAIGEVINAPAHLTTELAIAEFYAATVPNGTVYEVKPLGAVYHDGEFGPGVPCYVATSPGASIIAWAIPRVELGDWCSGRAQSIQEQRA